MKMQGRSVKGSMAEKGKTYQKSPSNKTAKSFSEIAEHLGETFIRGFFDLMSRFGLGGILSLLMVWFFQVHASVEQKQRIIDKCFEIHEEESKITRTVLITLLVTMVVWGQWTYFRNRMRSKDEEIKRLKAEKEVWRKALVEIELKTTKKGGKK